jgi:hypothetical protein
LVAAFHEQGNVEHMEHLPDGVDVVGHLPARMLEIYRRYVVNETTDQARSNDRDGEATEL